MNQRTNLKSLGFIWKKQKIYGKSPQVFDRHNFEIVCFVVDGVTKFGICINCCRSRWFTCTNPMNLFTFISLSPPLVPGDSFSNACWAVGCWFSSIPRFAMSVKSIHAISHKIYRDNHFLQSFPPFPLFNQCLWVCKLHQYHAADKLLPHNIYIGEWEGVLMELSLSFLRENPNKLCLIELSQNVCDWFSKPEKIYWKRKPKALSYFP